MKKIEPVATFRTGFAASRHAICVSGAMDAFDPNEPYSRIYILNEKAPNLWTFNEHDFVITSLCTWRDPISPTTRYFAAVGEDGEVVVLSPNMDYEEVADSGLRRAASVGYGYLANIKQIGNGLYACGYAGQVYRRVTASRWEHIDDGILQSPGIGPGAYMVRAIDGPHEQAIYIAGAERDKGHPGRADYWNGHGWRRLELPTGTGLLTKIHIESAQRVWMVGANGTLLLGNALDGFHNFGPMRETKLILSMALFNGIGYLGTNLGLYKFDPNIPGQGFSKVRTGLDPELQDANIVQAVDGVLWSIGSKDIARFDGLVWKRFHHPDNPPILPTGAKIP